MKIIIRPLVESDALISYKWRNVPEIWRYTGNMPDMPITIEIENKWIKTVLSRESERRFAICVNDEQVYIGNAQLTDINDVSAQYHMFIGEIDYWGKGIASEVAKLVLEYAFTILKVKEVYSYFKPENIASIKACEKSGFSFKNIVNKELLYVCNSINN